MQGEDLARHALSSSWSKDFTVNRTLFKSRFSCRVSVEARHARALQRLVCTCKTTVSSSAYGYADPVTDRRC
jgi:hypothetical protein